MAGEPILIVDDNPANLKLARVILVGEGYQVMTAADDGIAKRSFPFELAVAPNRTSPPILGQRYAAWE